MGAHGPGVHLLAASNLVTPDTLAGQTLFLLSNQPRKPTEPTDGVTPLGTGVSGSVWVRERFTIHQPLAADDPFLATGVAVGRETRRERRYGITSSRTYSSTGHVVATNQTVGLLSYQRIPGAEDSVDGSGIANTGGVGVDREAAAHNPHLAALSQLRPGDQFGGQALTLSWAMMKARDTDEPTNPIHSDLQMAKAAGLDRPIAGGSHVLAFALDPLIAALGATVLCHGSMFDVRWRAPVRADATITPLATVRAPGEHRPGHSQQSDTVLIDLEVKVEDAQTTGPVVAMTGTLSIPILVD